MLVLENMNYLANNKEKIFMFLSNLSWPEINARKRSVTGLFVHPAGFEPATC